MSELKVQLQAGAVRGKKENAHDGTEYFSFKGVPYAEPPVGELRFSDPQPLEPWAGVRETTSHGPNCAHKAFFTNETAGSDDCLYLNVYARCIAPEQGWPVMVYIHGGGFVNGSGDDDLYGPDFFMRKDVVLVTINYRTGVLGFLNLDHEMATGNQGLKDQVMALQWVRDNIANFGGDPSNVTIFGESAGGASVHYLTISSLAEGLFHKAIMQSGAALNPWAYHSNIKEKCYRVCEKLGHTSKDPKSIVEFLRAVDTNALIEAQENISTKDEMVQLVFSFGPSIDSKSEKPFMPVHPAEAAAKGITVPSIIGHNSREGIVFFKGISEVLDEHIPKTEEVLLPEVRDTFEKHYGLTPVDVMRIYFKGDTITNRNPENLIDFLGDVLFVEGIQRVVKNQIQTNRAPTYAYQFTYDKEPSAMKVTMNLSTMSGASHADDLSFLFTRDFQGNIVKLPEKGSVRYKISEQMIELWVNFATTGKPTSKPSDLLPIDWQPVDEQSGYRYLNICEDLRMEVANDIGQQYIERKYPKHTP